MILQEPALIEVPSFLVTGLSVKTKNEYEFNPETARLPALWQRFNALPRLSELPIYGIYSDYESDDKGFYTVTAGLMNGEAEHEFSSIRVEHGDYLVFKNQGPLPQAIIEAWQAVWSYFKSQSGVTRSYSTDFEVYKKDSCELYIGIKHKI